jgi:hypothetical protein
MQKQNGQRVPSDVLRMASPYLLVADVSRLRSQLDANVVKLVLLWGETLISEIAVEQPRPPIRRTERAELTPWGPKIANVCSNPRNAHADREFNGHGPKVDWSVSLSVTPDKKKLIARIHYHAIEWDEGSGRPQSDFTEACGDWTETVYSAAANVTILRVVDTPVDSGSYVDTNGLDDFASGKLYGRYILGGDRNGDDVGVSTKIQASGSGHVQIEVEVAPQ